MERCSLLSTTAHGSYLAGKRVNKMQPGTVALVVGIDRHKQMGLETSDIFFHLWAPAWEQTVEVDEPAQGRTMGEVSALSNRP